MGRFYRITMSAARSNLVLALPPRTLRQTIWSLASSPSLSWVFLRAKSLWVRFSYSLSGFHWNSRCSFAGSVGLPWYGYNYTCINQTNATICPIALVPFRGVNCSDAAGNEVEYSMIISDLLPLSTNGLQWDPRTPFNLLFSARINLRHS
jgi:hypothetical protein